MIVSTLTTCFSRQCGDYKHVVGKYYSIGDRTVTHYVELKEDGEFVHVYEKNAVKKLNTGVWQFDKKNVKSFFLYGKILAFKKMVAA